MTQLPSVGIHNTLVSFILAVLSILAYKIVNRIYEALKILTSLQPVETQVNPVDSIESTRSVLLLPGVSHLIDELQLLSRRHLEQIVASSSQLRSAPVATPIFHLLAHIEPENIVLSESRISFTVEIAANVSAHIFAATNVPFTFLENPSDSSQHDVAERSQWWRDNVISALLPCSKRFIRDEHAHVTDRENEHVNKYSRLRSLAANGTSIKQSQRAEITVSRIASDEVGIIPLVLGVAYGETFEVTLCRIGTSNRVEVVRQLILPEGLTICGLYGFEQSSTPECMICCDRRVNAVLLPCCHCSLCHSCAQNLRDGKCPICRGVYSSYISLPVHEEETEAVRLPQPSHVNASPTTPLLT